jgi:hypothetical protein
MRNRNISYSAFKCPKDIKYWDYTEVLEVHEALQKANESINKLGLVPVSL